MKSSCMPTCSNRLNIVYRIKWLCASDYFSSLYLLDRLPNDEVTRHWSRAKVLNTLALGRFERNFNKAIFKLIILIDGWIISHKTARRWKSLHLIDHYGDVIMDAIASLITSLTIVYSTVYSDADQKKNIKAPRHWPLCGNSPGSGEFPPQMACNVENISIWWRPYDKSTLVQVMAWCCQATSRYLSQSWSTWSNCLN